MISSAARAFRSSRANDLVARPGIKASLPAGSVVYTPERNARGQYPLWLTEVEARGFVAQRDVSGDAAVDRADSDVRRAG